MREKNKTISVRMTENERERMESITKGNNLTISEFVLRMMEYFEDANLSVGIFPKAQPRAAGKRAVLN